jgi:ribosome-binding protein aMBF1 (putative translation factor)
MDTEKGAKSVSQMRLEAEQLGLTSLAQLAETLQVDEETILRWESQNSIPFEYFKKWQTALGVSNKPANTLSATRMIRIRKTAS